MKRREFITLLGVAAAWPLAARAQQTAKTHRIALVHPSASIADMSESGGNPYYPALFKELRRLGYIEGVNLVVTRYSGEGRGCLPPSGGLHRPDSKRCTSRRVADST
jgi:putative tryptophan/tyrosine transport system substrate-binding protein